MTDNDFNNSENDSTNSRNEKRFTDNGFEAIEEQSFTDTLTDKTYYVDYFDEIIDLCNELNEVKVQLQEENKELKSENEHMKLSLSNISSQRDEFHRGARENANCIGKLKKENEQLKYTLGAYMVDLNNYKGKCSALEIENEELKKELKRCRDWINSDKNDYELTLAFIKNKGYSLKDVLEYEKELKE